MKMVSALRMPHRRRPIGTSRTLFQISSLRAFIDAKLIIVPSPTDV